MTLSVLTLNIWNYEGPWAQRLPLIRDCIATLDPDLIALQEVLVGGAIDQPTLLFEDTPYTYEFGGSRDFWLDENLTFGNLVASRWPLADTDAHVLPQRTGVGDCLALATRVDAPFGPVPFVSTHLTYPPYDGRVREQQVKAIFELIRARHVSGSFPAIVCGDFNARPESAEVRFMKGLQSIDGASTFFIDAFDAAGAGDGTTMSRTNPQAQPVLEMRLDYIFVGHPRPDGAGRVEHCRVVANDPVDGVYPSDHYGVYAEIGTSNN